MTATTAKEKIITLRKSSERGHANYGWLNSHHTFSFANYYDPAHMGWRNLRVINEDRIEGGTGFGTHPHRDMEIISYVLEGALEHKDTMGNSTIIRPGEVQRMSAGTGIAHSEYNYSQTDIAHFLQIWIQPAQKGLTPSYEQKLYSEEEKRNQLRLIASSDGKDGSITVHQDINLYVTKLDDEQSVEYQANPDRYLWVQVTRGQVMLDDYLLEAGDGAAISNADSLTLMGKDRAEVLLFDLA